MEWRKELRALFAADRLLTDEPMARHTTFRLGGPADALLLPQTEQELINGIRFARERNIPYIILGNGSNVLVTDKGIRGLVIRPGEGLSDISAEGETISAGAGATLAGLAQAALRCGLTGLEFASGIPGSVGGGLAMNAGAYGGQLSDVLKYCRILDRETLEIRECGVEELEMGYRTTRMLTRGDIVLRGIFVLKPGDPEHIKAKMEELNQKRRDKQPLNYPSAGSAFKRPEGNFAGALIEQAGLKGLTVGGAQVSEKHAGFIINIGGATAQNVQDLIKEVQGRVYAASGIMLQPEVRILGE